MKAFLKLGLPGITLIVVAQITAEVDVFGLTQIMPSKSPLVEWNSLHWAQGVKRTLSDWDPSDPMGWSRKRGDTQLMELDGQGMLRMGGVQPRIYFMASSTRPLFFRDVEVTGYFRRVGTDGASNGGFMVGVRTGPEGHASQPCLANTYYAGIRYPGTWIFDKELWHPNDSPGKSGRLFPTGQLMPAGRWLGMKYLVYNISGGAVKLELYADTVSNGNPVNGGTWFKLSEIVDDGKWSAPVGECGYSPTTIVTQGGGAILIRNTDAAEANYKMLTIREISVGTTSMAKYTEKANGPRAFWSGHNQGILLEGTIPKGQVMVSDLSGQRLAQRECTGAGACLIVLASRPVGTMVVLFANRNYKLVMAP